MPHVLIKMLPGRSEAQKADIAEKVTRAVMEGAKCKEDAVSVSIEDVASEDWTETVYKPDIMARPERLYKKPGYNPLK